MSRFHYKLMTVAVLLLFVAAGILGCRTSGTPAAEMMKVLPEDTDALFLYNHTVVQAVPEYTGLWNTLCEQTLPPGSSPAVMALASRNGNLTALLYTFDEPVPDYSENAAPQIHDYREITVTRIDDFWDSYQMGDVTIVNVRDETETIIDGYLNAESSMSDSPAFTCLDSISLDGVLVIIMDDIRIAGNRAAAGLSLDFAGDTDGLLIIDGVFDFGSNGKAESFIPPLRDYLDDFGVTVSDITQNGSYLKVAGTIAAVSAGGLVDGLTGDW